MKRIETSNAPAALGPYSQAWISNGLLFVSGQIALIPGSGAIDGDTVAQQAERCCHNVGAVLAAAGLSYADVVKTTCYLVNMRDFNAFNQVYAKFFITAPARSCVAVRELPSGVLCEIEVIATMEK